MKTIRLTDTETRMVQEAIREEVAERKKSGLPFEDFQLLARKLGDLFKMAAPQE